MKSANAVVLTAALSLAAAVGAAPTTDGALIATGKLAAGRSPLTDASMQPLILKTKSSTHPATPRSTAVSAAFSVDCTADGALNVDDFICFQKAFVSGSPSANCDDSQAAPVLNVLDFMCFINKFNEAKHPGSPVGSTPGQTQSH